MNKVSARIQVVRSGQGQEVERGQETDRGPETEVEVRSQEDTGEDLPLVGILYALLSVHLFRNEVSRAVELTR